VAFFAPVDVYRPVSVSILNVDRLRKKPLEVMALSRDIVLVIQLPSHSELVSFDIVIMMSLYKAH
jgi:hypothetical protein